MVAKIDDPSGFRKHSHQKYCITTRVSGILMKDFTGESNKYYTFYAL